MIPIQITKDLTLERAQQWYQNKLYAECLFKYKDCNPKAIIEIKYLNSSSHEIALVECRTDLLDSFEIELINNWDKVTEAIKTYTLKTYAGTFKNLFPGKAKELENGS